MVGVVVSGNRSGTKRRRDDVADGGLEPNNHGVIGVVERELAHVTRKQCANIQAAAVRSKALLSL